MAGHSRSKNGVASARLRPAILHFMRFALPRWSCGAAIEQRGDAANGDAPVDAARSVGLFFRILRAITLRGQVLRRHPELLSQQFGSGFGAATLTMPLSSSCAIRNSMARMKSAS